MLMPNKIRKSEQLAERNSITSAHKQLGGREWSGGKEVRLQNGGIAQMKSRHEITGLCWLHIATKTTKILFVQPYESIHLYITNFHEARSITRPKTTIQACHTTQKRHMLKPVSSIWFG